MGVNYNGALHSTTGIIVEKAGAKMDDCRSRILTYDGSGNVILAIDGTKPILGIAAIEAGLNDISGREPGKVEVGDDVDVIIKDIAYVIASAAIQKGREVTAAENGTAKVASNGDNVLGIALSSAAKKDEYVKVQIVKYQKNA